MTRTINKVAKGRTVESYAIVALEAEGYVIHRTIRTSQHRSGRWISHANDVLGCIDIIAKRSRERTRWIQVTAGRDVGRKKERLRMVPFATKHDSVEIWRWVAGRKRIDQRNGKPRDRNYFQIYTLDDDFALDKSRRIRPPGFVDPLAETQS